MKMRSSNLIFALALITFCFYTKAGYSQKIKEIELEGSVMSSDLDNGISIGLSLKYNYWVNPYIGLTMGGNINYSKIDLSFNYNNKSSYYLDNPIFNLNAIMGLKFATPTYKRIGIMTDLIFVFAPIPFNLVDVDKETSNPNTYSERKNKNKIVYTHFNPSYMAEISLFHDSKSRKNRGRISMGGGISNYNPYNTYYRAKADGIKLRNYLKLKPEDISFVIFVRLTGTT